ncbi:hypothetical protein BDZ89DRAFT_1130225 [Hymenopellis radicata]|nr:hypothetical protein BDZ89DRAFT_1130225 [Hymenopellis radicata]
MSRALTLGVEIVFHCFIQDEWMPWMSSVGAVHLGNLHVWRNLSAPLRSYVTGLSTVSASADSMRHEFLEHLYEPRNLILIVLSEILAGRQPKLLYKAVRLHPQHHSWAVCQEALNALVVWAKSPNRRVIPFPLQDIFDSPLAGYSDFRDAFRRLYEEDVAATLSPSGMIVAKTIHSKLIQALESGLHIIKTGTEERSDDAYGEGVHAEDLNMPEIDSEQQMVGPSVQGAAIESVVLEGSDDTYGEGATDGIEQALHAEDLDIPEIDSEQQMPGPSVQGAAIESVVLERSDDTYSEGAADSMAHALHVEDLDMPEIDSEQQMSGPSVQAP